MAMPIVIAALVLATAWLLLVLGIDPVPTWFYVVAWYPTLVVLDGIAVRREHRRSLFADRSLLLSLFAWSPVIWLVFEAANFRLENWYYVSLPDAAWQRWTGILLSFATVVPALVLAERVLSSLGVFTRLPLWPVTVRPAHLRAVEAAGWLMAALALLRPATFFPLIWGAAFLIADPFVYRRVPNLSLLADLQRGSWGRVARLMVGGLGVGLLWEAYNFWARGKWVYTVPWLEGLKVFEMPPVGLLGFPVFALEAWAMYAALAAVGVAVPVVGAGAIVRWRLVLAGVVGLTFALVTLRGMDHYTVSSTAPSLRDLPGASAARLAALDLAGIRTPYQLADTDPTALSGKAGLDSGTTREMIESAQLVTLRGIGARHARTLNALGIQSVCDLAERQAGELTRSIGNTAPAPRPTPAEVRVWLRAARRTCDADLPLPE